MYCDNCGKEIPAKANFCPYCGKRIENKIESNEDILKFAIKHKN